MAEYEQYSPTILRVILGLLFFLPGVMKLMTLINTGTHAMLVGLMGMSVAVVWLLALVEVLFGLAVLLGFQLRWTVWPLVIVMFGAIFMAVIPGRADNPMWIINLFFHLLAVASLVSLSLTGPGAASVGK